MTTANPAPSSMNETELKKEAAQVERLRRGIAELPAKGQSATPQMLADFAKAQKSYLDHKIVFEKQKRESGVPKVPTSESKPVVASVAVAKEVPARAVATASIEPTTSSKRSSGLVKVCVIAAALGIGVGLAIWFLVTR